MLSNLWTSKINTPKNACSPSSTQLREQDPELHRCPWAKVHIEDKHWWDAGQDNGHSLRSRCLKVAVTAVLHGAVSTLRLWIGPVPMPIPMSWVMILVNIFQLDSKKSPNTIAKVEGFVHEDAATCWSMLKISKPCANRNHHAPTKQLIHVAQLTLQSSWQVAVANPFLGQKRECPGL